MGAYRHIEVTPFDAALGAMVAAPRLDGDLAEPVVAEIRQALLEHLMIALPEQDIAPEAQVGFARRLGEIHIHPLMVPMAGFPEILEIIKRPEETYNFGSEWHSDQMFLPEPSMATILRAVEVPPRGGDTLFANMYAAYEALSPAMQGIVGGMRGISDSAAFDARRPKAREAGDGEGGDAAGRRMAVKQAGARQTATHPLVRTHPETGRKALYIGGHVLAIEGLHAAESRALLDFLMAHATAPEFTCRLAWQPGQIAIWDNRCTQHNALNDYPDHVRVMRRVTLCGDAPY